MSAPTPSPGSTAPHAESLPDLPSESELLSALRDVQSEFLLGGEPRDAFDRVLKTLLKVTRSEYGFIGEILHDPNGRPYLKTHAITNIAWNDETRRFYDENAPAGMEFHNRDTLFGTVMTSSEPVIANSPATDPRRGGLPPGHPPLNAFLGLPFRAGATVVGMIGVANRRGGYDERVVRFLEPLLATCGSLVARHRADVRRRLAEEALRLSEAQLQQVLATALDAVVTIDSEGIILTWNPQAEAIFGWSADQVIGRPLHDVIIPERHREAHKQGMKRYLATRRPRMLDRRLEVWGLRNSGEELPLELTVAAIPTGDGVVFNSFIRDITERRRAEAELRETNSRLSALIQNLGAGLLVEDENRRIRLVNDELLRMFGLPGSSDDLLGVDCGEAAHELSRLFVDPDGFVQGIDDTLAKRELALGKELRLRDGRVLECDYVPIFIDDLYRGHLWQYRDVTARKRSEEDLLEQRNQLSVANARLARASRLKDEFLASMSHELRTPLNAVLGLTEALQAGVFGQAHPKQTEPLSWIEESGRHLLHLINDILDLSKVEAGRLEVDLTEVDTEALCTESVRFVQQAAQAKHLRVSQRLAPGLPRLHADPVRVKQILVNLLSNAVKFTPDGGSIGLDVAADETTDSVRFTVWDTGIGIARSDVPRLFRPFEQLDSSLTRPHTGTGLGLALARRLAELHGGGIEIESVEGAGSRFTVNLPRMPVADDVDLVSTRFAEGLDFEDQPGILVIESPDRGPDSASRLLAELGARALAHGRAARAPDFAAAVSPDVILLDDALPDGSGWTVLEDLRRDRRTASIRVVMMVDAEAPPRTAGTAGAQVQARLTRPLSAPSLRQALGRYLPPQRTPSAGVPSVRVPDAAAPKEGPLLLLAEDNEINIRTVERFLSTQGYRLAVARSGAEALERIQRDRPALVLMDIQMPDMDGLEVTRRLRADPATAQLPVVALTALAMPGDRERCLAAGADAYLSKPVPLKGLSETIARLLRVGGHVGSAD